MISFSRKIFALLQNLVFSPMPCVIFLAFSAPEFTKDICLSFGGVILLQLQFCQPQFEIVRYYICKPTFQILILKKMVPLTP